MQVSYYGAWPGWVVLVSGSPNTWRISATTTAIRGPLFCGVMRPELAGGGKPRWREEQDPYPQELAASESLGGRGSLPSLYSHWPFVAKW